MKTILTLCVSVFVLMPDHLHAFYSVAQMNADTLRKDLSIKIRVHKSGNQIAFIVALRRRADSQDVCWHGALDLVASDGTPMGRVETRGEDIRRALDEETLRNWGWQNFGPAEVFRFTVAARMLTQSKFTRETGPRNDEHGIPYGGGIIRWSYLEDLDDAAENADKTGATNGSQPIRSATNRTSSAAGSCR